MGSNDSAYIYGDSNGATYDGNTAESDRHVHWDPRIEVSAIAHTVQVGIVPASDRSTDESGLWDRSEGQFLSLSRDGINRLIVALREARTAAYGRDE
jgi:hypothetical protein